MIINISKELYNELIKRCKKTKDEISGIMTSKIDGNNITIQEIKMDTSSIKSNTKDEIQYDVDEYIDKTINEMLNNPLHISFHTHPGFSQLAHLSYSDKKLTKLKREIAKQIAKETKSERPIIIDCIINRKEMAFYIMDEESEEIIRLPLYVDGKEIVPSHERMGIKYYSSYSMKEIGIKERR